MTEEQQRLISEIESMIRRRMKQKALLDPIIALTWRQLESKADKVSITYSRDFSDPDMYSTDVNVDVVWKADA